MNYVVDRVSDSGVPLIDLQEAKEYLKVSHDLEDQTITNLIERVINGMEAYMWTSLQSSIYKVYVDCFSNGVLLKRGPVDAITSVQYYDSSNTLQTLDSSGYFLSRAIPDRLMRAHNTSWPPTYNRPDAVIVTYSTNPNVESQVKERALKIIGYLYENRSGAEISINELFGAMVSGIRKNHL